MVVSRFIAFIFILSNNMNLIKKKKSPFLAKIKFEPTFFQVLWQFAFPLPLFSEAGGRGVRGGIPPAEPIIEKIGSDFFKYTPPVGI